MAVKNIFTYLTSGGIFTMTAYNWNAKMEQKGLQKEGVFGSGISYFRYTPEEIKSLLETCGFEDITVRGYNNFGCYGILGNNKFANLILYPVAILDYLISKFDFSARTGTYLVCTGVKKQPYRWDSTNYVVEFYGGSKMMMTTELEIGHKDDQRVCSWRT